jgi:hypothetical protein
MTPAMTQLGILIALLCALATNVGFLCKHRGAIAAPAVELRRPLHSAAALFRSRWFAIGFAIAALAWALHVTALAIAPLSLVQTVVSGGLVMLAYPAERWFGLHVGRRERAGLLLSAAGLVLLAITSDGFSQGPSANYSVTAMVAFEAGVVGIGALLLVSGSIGSARGSTGIFLGVATGLLLGVSDVSIKALTGTVPQNMLALLSPWTAVALIAAVVAFFSLARGLQTGSAIPVITLTSVAANCSAVLGGVLVFGDPVGGDPLSVVARATAFAAVIGAAALMPAPLRAAGARA